MGEVKAGWNTLRGLTVHHGKITLLGLAVVLVPIVVVSKSIEHAHKLVSHAVSQVSPEVEVAGGIVIATIILIAILLACWFVGWLVSRTERGKLLMEWEKSKLLGRSPLQLQKGVKKVHSMRAGKEAPAPAKEVQPALAHVAGGWQPGVIVEEQADGWASVFLPDIPSIATGRLYLVHEDQILRLEVPLDVYRKKLTATGHGSQDWMQALSAAKADAGGATP